VSTAFVSPPVTKAAPSTEPTLSITLTSEGGSFTGFRTEGPVDPSEYENLFSRVYKFAGLTAEDYRITNETVRMKAWQVPFRTPDGDMDTILIFSYDASFTRISNMDRETERVVNELAARMRLKRQTVRRTPGAGLGPESSFTVMFSDWQLGKNEIRDEDRAHGTTGVEQTTWRVERAIDSAKRRVKELRRAGRNVTGIALAHMGDPTEGLDSYANQAFILELNIVQQMEIALHLMTLGAEELLPLADSGKQDMIFTLCNHGQLARRSSKSNITDDSDNVQNHLAMLLKDYIIGPRFKDVRWHIPGLQMITTLNLAGVDVAAAHGHKIAGSEDNWLLKQTALLGATRGAAPTLWLTAHRHSQDSRDLGSLTRIQAATADGGSPHFTDTSAIYSTPGTTSLLIGKHDERGYSDLELL